MGLELVSVIKVFMEVKKCQTFAERIFLEVLNIFGEKNFWKWNFFWRKVFFRSAKHLWRKVSFKVIFFLKKVFFLSGKHFWRNETMEEKF